MAFNIGNGDQSVVSEINVTPLVDVMLVLLIVFMIAAPMMVQGLAVNLPQVTTKAMDTKSERLVLTLTAEKELLLDDVSVGRENLIEKIKAVLAQRPDQTVYVRADESVQWGFLAEIMAALQGAGVEKVGMVTEPLGAPRPSKKERAESKKDRGSEQR